MKSGTGDDPFADEADESGETDETPPEDVERAVTEPASDRQTGDEAGADALSELPYKYRRESVKEGRTQQPMFLQDSTADLIERTVDEMEAEFDEDVYKTDVVEALLVAGAESASPAAVLRRWGYGMKNR